MKCDPYINVDPGTMSPFQHGEVYVTDDGAETDLDLGHYERFTDVVTSRKNNLTTGRVYQSVIEKETPRRLPRLHRPGHPPHHGRDQGRDPRRRRGPRRRHRRDRRHRRRHRVAAVPRGDPPVPAGCRARQRHQRARHARAVPQRARRAQDQAHAALGEGAALDRDPARHPGVPRGPPPPRGDAPQDRAVLQRRGERGDPCARTADTIYDVPLRLAAEGLDGLLLDAAQPAARQAGSRPVADHRGPHPQARRGMSASASSASTSTSSTATSRSTRRCCTAASPTTPRSSSSSSTPRSCEEEAYVEELFQVDGILVPGGFGKRGIEGMIQAIEFARGHKIPFLGICLGLQTAVIEFARNVCNLERANSSEFVQDPPYKVIYKMRELRRRGRDGRHDAPGQVPLPAQARVARVGGVRRRHGLGAPPPPLRGQPRLRTAPRAARPAGDRAARPTASSWR